MREIYLRINGSDDVYNDYSLYLSRVIHVRLKTQCSNVSFWCFRHSVSPAQVEELDKLTNLKHFEVRSMHSYVNSLLWRSPSRLRRLKPSTLPDINIRSLLSLRLISISVCLPGDFSLILAAALTLVQFKMKIFHFSSSISSNSL